MIVDRKSKNPPIVLDLDGPDSNVFVLLGIASRLMKQLEYSPEDREKALDKMKSGDYENLIKVLDEELGDYLIIYK